MPAGQSEQVGPGEEPRICQIWPGQATSCASNCGSAEGWLAERSFGKGARNCRAPLPPGRELVVMVGGRPARPSGSDADKDWQAEVARLAASTCCRAVVRLRRGRPGGFVDRASRRFISTFPATAGGPRPMGAAGGPADSVDRQGRRRSAGRGATPGPFAPGRFVESLPLRQSTALEIFAGTNERLDRVVEPQGNFGSTCRS